MVDDDILFRRAEAYARERDISYAALLGSGIHGMVRVAEHKGLLTGNAVKIHRYQDAYHREKAVYLRLREAGLVSIRSFHVPQLQGWSDGCQAIEMSIVVRPFVLDFAGAWLDALPEFSPEVWRDWEAEKQELFGERWSEVQQVLTVLKSHGIFMFDVSPANVAFGN